MAAYSVAAYPKIPSESFPTIKVETEHDPTVPSDDTLVELAREGEPNAFGTLIERHNRLCLAVAYSILRNRCDAEEEVQAAWVQVWEHLGSYQRQGCFCAWLRRIVSNQCLMRLRKARLVPQISVDEVSESAGAFRIETIDQRGLPEELVGDDQVSRVLMQEISRVPAILREVLIMRDLNHLVMRDIAQQLGISVPAVKSRLMRARLEMRHRLAKHHGERGCVTLFPKSGRARAAFVRAN